MEIESASELESRKADVYQRLGRFGRQLCNFANLDPAFKNGRSDYTCLEAVDAERVEPELPENFEGDEEGYYDDEVPSVAPEATFIFKFEAERQRFYDEIGDELVEKAHVQFILSVTGINKHVHMPEHIAEEVIGLPGKEAVREIGPVTLKAMTTFTLTTGINRFSVCDHAEYLDMDDGPMHEAACSCENNILFYTTDREVNDLGDVLMLSDEDIKQHPSLDLLQKSSNEVVSYHNIDTAVEEWQQMADIGLHIDTDVMEDRLARAEFTLGKIQEVIWTKAGLTHKQQQVLRKKLQVAH